jgi:hypothetical protein
MQPDSLRQDLRGVALLMRQGLAAWMRSVGEPAPHAASSQRSSTIEQMLVNIVAAMALSNVVEEINA